MRRFVFATVYCTFAFALTVQGATFCICPHGGIALEAACEPSTCCPEESSAPDCGHDHAELEIVACADAQHCIDISIPLSGTDGVALVATEWRGTKAKPFDETVTALHGMKPVLVLTDADSTAPTIASALTASAQTASAPMPLILRL